MKMENRTVIVFGGANGIGQASVLLLAEAGANVVIADRDADMAEQVAKILTGQDRQAVGLACDVSSDADVKAVIDKTVETFGGIHALVNCVGVGLRGNVEETSNELWDRNMTINLKSVYTTCHYAMPYLKKTGGAIVNISSTQALIPVKNHAAYASAKGGMISLTRSLAVDYAKDAVRANVICPGGVSTNLAVNSARFETLIPDTKSYEPNIDPFRPIESFDTESRLLSTLMPEDIGRVVVFLACNDSRGMTGQTLVVDGGYGVNAINNGKED